MNEKNEQWIIANEKNKQWITMDEQKTRNGLSLKEVGKYKPIYFFDIFVCSHSYTTSWVNSLTSGSSFQNVILFSCGIDSKCDVYNMKLAQYNEYVVSAVGTDALVF